MAAACLVNGTAPQSIAQGLSCKLLFAPRQFGAQPILISGLSLSVSSKQPSVAWHCIVGEGGWGEGGRGEEEEEEGKGGGGRREGGGGGGHEQTHTHTHTHTHTQTHRHRHTDTDTDTHARTSRRTSRFANLVRTGSYGRVSSVVSKRNS